MGGNKGKRRSVFKIDVHLGGYATLEAYLSAWSSEIDQLRQIGHESKADKLQEKLNRLQELTEKGE
jgi:hypothetical protein